MLQRAILVFLLVFTVPAYAEIRVVENTYDDVTIEWDAMPNAAEYVVWWVYNSSNYGFYVQARTTGQSATLQHKGDSTTFRVTKATTVGGASSPNQSGSYQQISVQRPADTSGIDRTPPSSPYVQGCIGASNWSAPGECNLVWSVASDNVGVEYYSVKLNGALIGETPDNNLWVLDLAPWTFYFVTVQAVDAAGNASYPAYGYIYTNGD